MKIPTKLAPCQPILRFLQHPNVMNKIYLLYSFPLRIGTPGNGVTAWHQLEGLVNQGIEVYLYAGSCEIPLQGLTSLKETLKPFGLKLPIRLVGMDRAAALHDRIVAKALRRLNKKIDIVHCWPSGSLETLKTAKKLGIKTVLERPSSHTRFVYKAVAEECKKLSIEMPKSHYTAFNNKRLAREEREFDLADKLLCPSEWVAKTFLDQGTSRNRIARHQYGFDREKFGLPSIDNRDNDKTFRMIFVGSGEPRKGLHYALDAWLASEASKKGVFYICGTYVQGYREVLAKKLAHPSIKELGFQSDVNSLLQKCHALVLPSISEGSAIVTYEARACGCVPLVSEATGAICEHMKDSLIHKPGDVDTLRDHIDLLASDRELLSRLRDNSLAGLSELTWAEATRKLLKAYQESLGADG
ncbi:MAG: glycosyltransferase family 4 protein [Desulfobacteraceae bacterium]|nr:glycosyltransferase family 4 protein [Desulfobacteraceae bacterium]